MMECGHLVRACDVDDVIGIKIKFKKIKYD